jgi:hypothetical protein
MLNPLRSVAAIPNHAVGKKREGAGLENRKEGQSSAESFESLAPEETRHDILSSHVRPSAMKFFYGRTQSAGTLALTGAADLSDQSGIVKT